MNNTDRMPRKIVTDTATIVDNDTTAHHETRYWIDEGEIVCETLGSGGSIGTVTLDMVPRHVAMALGFDHSDWQSAQLV